MQRELVLTVNVIIGDTLSVSGHTRSVSMVAFTGTAEGRLFTGSVVGTGYDRQLFSKDGSCSLSARYILKGIDTDGCECSIFIENNSLSDGTVKPMIATDSKALAFLESCELVSEIEPHGNDVTIKIYKI